MAEQQAPELTIDFLREKEAMYRRMATQYHDMHFAAKGAADALMLMVRDLTPDEPPAASRHGSDNAETASGER